MHPLIPRFTVLEICGREANVLGSAQSYQRGRDHTIIPFTNICIAYKEFKRDQKTGKTKKTEIQTKETNE